MELLNQPTPNILLQFEEVYIDREECDKFLILCRRGVTRIKCSSYCVECFHAIPFDETHFRRLPCHCKFHSLCLLRLMKREGVDQSGSFTCKQCICKGFSSQCSL